MIIIFSISLSLVLLWINQTYTRSLTVQEVTKNPDLFINQTIYVTGILSSQPLPHPTKYLLSSNSESSESVGVDWNSTIFLIPHFNDTTATVYGVLREENWSAPNVNPPNSTILHVYYIEASQVVLC